MAPLLELPRELLHEIIEYSLSPPFIPISTSNHVNSTDWVTSGSPRRSSRVRSKDHEPIMLYSKKKPLYSLLFICRKLNPEVQDVLNRVGETLPCEASVNITNDGDFLVTWLSIPPSMLNPNLAREGYHVPTMNIRVRFPHAPWTSGELRNIHGQVLCLFSRLIEDVLSFGPKPQDPPTSYRAPRRTRIPGGGLVRKSTGGKALRIRRVNYIDSISITLHPPHPPSASVQFIQSPRTIMHIVVDKCIQRAFESCIVDFVCLHKTPVEGGDENGRVMEAWCYSPRGSVKKVEVKVDQDTVGWLQVVKDPNHPPPRNGLYDLGDTTRVRGWLEWVGCWDLPH